MLDGVIAAWKKNSADGHWDRIPSRDYVPYPEWPKYSHLFMTERLAVTGHLEQGQLRRRFFRHRSPVRTILKFPCPHTGRDPAVAQSRQPSVRRSSGRSGRRCGPYRSQCLLSTRAKAGGFRTWWRLLNGGDETLDDTHWIRLSESTNPATERPAKSPRPSRRVLPGGNPKARTGAEVSHSASEGYEAFS